MQITQLSCPTLACEAIADVFQVNFILLVSYSRVPVTFIYPQDPDSRSSQVFYLSITTDSLEDPDRHCDSIVPMHYRVHEPAMIPQKVMTWMKMHGISISEGDRLVQYSTFSHGRTSSYDHTKHQRSPPGEHRISAKSKTYEVERMMRGHCERSRDYRDNEDGRATSAAGRSRKKKKKTRKKMMLNLLIFVWDLKILR